MWKFGQMTNKFRNKIALTILFFFAILSTSRAVDDLPFGKLSSYEGLHFLVGFMSNEWRTLNSSLGVEQKLFISATKQANVTVRMPGRAPFTVTIQPEDVHILEIPNTLENKESEVIKRNAIDITSDVPITIYGFSSQERTSDSYAAIPITNWGNEYVVVSVANDQYDPVMPPTLVNDSLDVYSPRRSQFMIMAEYDNTIIEITPTSVTDKGKQANQPFEVVLNSKEIYLVKSFAIGKGGGDLTGTYIKSNKPVGVLSGHERATVPIGLPGPFDSKDHLIEMLPPVNSWGRRYFSIPFAITPAGDYFKILTRTPNTKVSVITQDGQTDYDIINPRNALVIEGLNSAAMWVSNHPIQVAQFMMRSTDTTAMESYDPCLVILPPVEQFVQRVLFHTPGNVFFKDNQYENHYVSVVAERAALDYLKLDGVLLKNTTNISDTFLPGTDLHYAKIQLQMGTHELYAEQGKFSGVIWGIGRFDSYGMILGSSLQNPFNDDKIPPTITVNIDCYEIDGVITDEINQQSYGIHYAWVVPDSTYNFKWEFAPFKPDDEEIKFKAWVIDSTKNARFMIDFYDKNGNGRRYAYTHKGVNLTVPQQVIFDNINWRNPSCRVFSITNTGIEPKSLESIRILTDSRLTLTPVLDFPYQVKPKETIEFELCFTPDGDSTAINSILKFEFECDIIRNIAILGEVEAADIEVLGHNFGSILLGDSVCHYARVTNIGNTELDLYRIESLTPNSAFIFELPEFPVKLQPFESIDIPVCFFPGSRGEFISEFEVINSKNLENSFTLIGKSLAPDVSSVVHEWGRVRVGDRVEDSIELINVGDSSTVLSFKEFQLITYPDETSTYLESLSSVDLQIDEPFNIDISFTPEAVGIYELVAVFEVDWKVHPPVIITINGIGTLPEIITNDVVLPDTEVFLKTNVNEIILTAAGNEDLYIQSAYVIDGDVDIITVDLSSLEDITINSGQTRAVPIEFAPLKSGDYSIRVAVINDAMPNYALREDTLTIRGRAVNPTEIFTEIEFDVQDFQPCINSFIPVIVKNESSIPLELTRIDISKFLNSGDFDYEILQADLVNNISEAQPYTILPNSELELDIRIIPIANTVGELNLEFGFFNESHIFNADIPIVTITNSVTMQEMETVFLEPDINKTITIAGKYEIMVESPFTFEILIDARADLFKVIPNTQKLTFSSNTYQPNLEQNVNQIRFVQENIAIDSENWILQFEVKPFLSYPLNRDINVNLIYNECYEAAETLFMTEIIDVCAYELRGVAIDTNLHNFQIIPNPVSENMTINVYNPDDGVINLKIIDILGKESTIFEDLFLKKGYHSLIYSLKELPNGLYFLSLEILGIIDNKLLIINK